MMKSHSQMLLYPSIIVSLFLQIMCQTSQDTINLASAGVIPARSDSLSNSLAGKDYCYLYGNDNTPTQLYIDRSSYSALLTDCVDYFQLHVSSSYASKRLLVQVTFSSDGSIIPLTMPVFLYEVTSRPSLLYTTNNYLTATPADIDLNGN